MSPDRNPIGLHRRFTACGIAARCWVPIFVKTHRTFTPHSNKYDRCLHDEKPALKRIPLLFAQ
jgi:hypothetical protein